jgi:hypothetical protein
MGKFIGAMGSSKQGNQINKAKQVARQLIFLHIPCKKSRITIKDPARSVG